MLKGKKGIYILIPVNILIWGVFVYRFYSLYNDGGEAQVENSEGIVKFEGAKDSIDYKLTLSYSDPFLKKEAKSSLINKSKAIETKQPTTKKAQVKKEEPEKLLPEIKYLGLVKNSTSGSVTAIVSINGSSRLIKQDETVNGLCFKSFTNENLTVLWNKEKIIIPK